VLAQPKAGDASKRKAEKVGFFHSNGIKNRCNVSDSFGQAISIRTVRLIASAMTAGIHGNNLELIAQSGDVSTRMPSVSRHSEAVKQDQWPALAFDFVMNPDPLIGCVGH
jgi:hypothetical protein